jgi:hypothetical protein
VYEKLFASHPVLTVLATSAFIGLIGWFEYRIGKSPRSAYLTWGVTGVSLAGFFILRFVAL